ncbi:MAG: uL30 family ribosomal protein [Nitrososphaerales archaeon]
MSKARSKSVGVARPVDDSKDSLLVVNMRGLINTRTPVRKTLEQLKLLRRFNATIVPDNEMYRGMLISAKEHLAWCKLETPIAEILLSKRLEVSNGKKVKESDLKTLGGFSSFSELATELVSGRARLNGTQGFRQFFRLSPPKGGFRLSTRRQYGEGGVLGPNKELLKTVENMI